MLTRRSLLIKGIVSATIAAPAVAKQNVTAVSDGKKAKTPYDFGARGGAVVGSCTLEKGATSISGIGAKDAGKVVMIAGGSLDARSLVTSVKEDGTLRDAVLRDLINVTYHVGYDDTAALQRFLDGGGGTIPEDTFLCQRPPLKYGDNCEIRWQGTILIGDAWPSGFGLMSVSYGWTGRERRIKNLVIQGEGNGTLLQSPARIDISPGRKGLGVTCTDGFHISGLRIAGGIGSLFALQIHYSTSGTVRDCRLSVDGLQYHQGSDGLHFIGSCADVNVVRLHTWTADDASSQTSEIPLTKNTTIERVTYEDCVLENYGHSSIKGLITAQAGASVIQDVTYNNCKFITYLGEKGNGVPFIITNDGKANGAIIRRITVTGGESVVNNDYTKQIAAPAIQLKSVDQFTLKDHSLTHCSNTAIAAEDCAGLVIDNVRIAPKRMLPAETRIERQVGVLQLNKCPGASVSKIGLSPSYPGQQLVIVHN